MCDTTPDTISLLKRKKAQSQLTIKTFSNYYGRGFLKVYPLYPKLSFWTYLMIFWVSKHIRCAPPGKIIEVINF